MRKHLSYVHTPNKSLVETLTGGIAQVLARRLLPQQVARRLHVGRRLVSVIALCLALVIQAALLVLVAQLVDVIHGVMGLYLDLARQQLDLTSIYVAATTPK